MRVITAVFLLFLALCLVESHQHSHSQESHHGHSHGHSHEHPSYKYSAEANQQSGLLKILLGFAAGGLLGDAFLHLIPHSLEQMIHMQKGKDSAHGHSHSLDTPQMRVGCYVLCGILIFLFIEKILLTFNKSSGHSHESNKKSNKGSKNKPEQTNSEDEHFRISAFLNLIADFTHNFTDGLAIGASFLVNRNVGFVTTATVLFHELPHEVGDYAILMQSGYSRKKAMLLQLVTAIGALVGAALSLITAGVNIGFTTKAITKDDLEMTSRGILPVTAGGFIYIAMVTVMPSLLKKSNQSSFIQNLGEIFALFAGIGLMVLVSVFE